MGFSFEGPDATGKITMKSEMVIQYATRLRESFMQALETTSRLDLDLEGLVEIDLSGLQVFCSAHRTAVALQKEMAIAGRWPEALRVAAEESGFAPGRRCGIATAATCFWNTGSVS